MAPRRGLWLAGGLAFVAAAVAALLLGLQPFAADGVHRLEAGDDGATLEMSVGEEIALELEGNPTTGYAWQVAEIDPAVLVAAGDPGYTASSDADGAGGTYTFRFAAVGPGETTLVLLYYPSWEEPSDQAGRFAVTVVVE
jgi:inhibitor of cysteine peptidase